MTLNRAGLVLVLTLAVSFPAVGQEQPSVSLQAAVEPSEITLGGRVTLTLTLTRPPGGEAAWPDPQEKVGPFEVLDFRVLAPADGGRDTRTRAQYELTAFEVGELEIPALEVQWVPPDGGDPLTAASQALTVTVQSLNPDEQGDIRGIKPPLGIPRNWWIVAGWVAVATALAALAFWAYRRYRRRPVPEKPVPTRVIPDRPPHETALEALERLEASPLLERGEIKQYYIEVSEIIRVYLEGRYGIVAMEMTSSEVMQQLEQKRLGIKQMEAFRSFFDRCDLVKFAKLRPMPERNRQIVPQARTLVEQTKEEPHAEAQRRREGDEGEEKLEEPKPLASVSSVSLRL